MEDTEMMGGAFGTMAGFGGLGMVLGILFWVALVALLVWGAQALFTRRDQPSGGAPLEILQRRYARGEISEAEYLQAKRALG